MPCELDRAERGGHGEAVCADHLGPLAMQTSTPHNRQLGVSSLMYGVRCNRSHCE
jgi:hypothetical protein